ncbi:Rne/Rng family ribonuclease [Mumia sp. zg.B21]|uniref:ribonuclease E/G n=1 Tax=Mumia sp. zg.B21 TaxID=2855447 RepID=UPI001C6EE752|nr:ribonuclease E/G [Mumia sp. zg.B21]MBW9211186.1 Rne/Rng family ribonuclease [Mumia sp. zg.B21]
MLDEQNPPNSTSEDVDTPQAPGDQPVAAVTRRRRTASRPAGPPTAAVFSEPGAPAKPARSSRSRKAPASAGAAQTVPEEKPETSVETAAPEAAEPPKVTRTTRTRKKAASRSAGPADPAPVAADVPSGDTPAVEPADELPVTDDPVAPAEAAPAVVERVDEVDEVDEEDEQEVRPATSARAPFVAPLFQAPEPKAAPRRRRRAADVADETEDREEDGRGYGSDDRRGRSRDDADLPERDHEDSDSDSDEGQDESDGSTPGRRRRRRGGRRRRRSGNGDDVENLDLDAESDSGEAAEGATTAADETPDESEDDDTSDDESSSTGEDDSGTSSRRRRRRRRRGEDSDAAADDPENTVVRVRERRSAEDEITSVSGSTRLEAKKQRRREGREAGRRRTPIVSEAEFLARRESVKREMVIRQREDLTQIAVLEDDVLVEHYVARESQTSLIGNVYLGRVQNVLPSMEAAFVDIGKGRNAVLYAGEVDWSKLGDGKPRKIEEALKSGQSVLVQVSKDPVGHKGARLTSQISLPGRFLVYVPGGQTSGISRKLPDTERNRLKSLLKGILPEDAGVIIRTAAEGATEDQLTRDVEALDARWKDIEKKAASASAPQLLYGEPDLTIKVVRDLFNEDFARLVVEGTDATEIIDGYVSHVAPDLKDRVEAWSGSESGDVFSAYRIDEQIAKALDRKVWLPSGGSLVIDRTEAMTVVDVNTGKFTGSGGNLEETVTKNNLEAAEEIVRQLRLRDIGGIIVVDFIDMVLESNRDLVLRRLVECLGRDRTRHQVAEVTSLGLVQMTRKRIGTGLLEAFSEPCEHCHGRGLMIHDHPVESKRGSEESRRGRSGRGRGRSDEGDKPAKGADSKAKKEPKPADDAQPEAPEPTSHDTADAATQETPEATTPRKRRRRRSGSEESSDGPSAEAGVEAPGTLDGGAPDPALTGDRETP